MVASLQCDDAVVRGEVDEAVLIGDATRPSALEDVSQGLRFPDPGERVAKRVLEEPVDPLQRRPVDRLPAATALPAMRREDGQH